MKINYLPLL